MRIEAACSVRAHWLSLRRRQTRRSRSTAKKLSFQARLSRTAGLSFSFSFSLSSPCHIHTMHTSAGLYTYHLVLTYFFVVVVVVIPICLRYIHSIDSPIHRHYPTNQR